MILEISTDDFRVLSIESQHILRPYMLRRPASKRKMFAFQMSEGDKEKLTSIVQELASIALPEAEPVAEADGKPAK